MDEMDETIIDERLLRDLLDAGIETIKVEEHIIEALRRSFNSEKLWFEQSKDNLEFFTRDETNDPPSLRKVMGISSLHEKLYLGEASKVGYTDAPAASPFLVEVGSPSRNELREGCFVLLKEDGTIDALSLHEIEEKWKKDYIQKKKEEEEGRQNNRLEVEEGPDLANRHPLFLRDLENSIFEPKPFIRSVTDCVVGINPKSRGLLIISCGGVQSYIAKILNTPFENGNIPQIQSSKLSIKEAFFTYFQEMTYITLFMVCYTIAWILILPLRPSGVKFFLVLLLVYVPVSYLPELVGNASGEHYVTCGSLKLPLMFFKTLGAFGISLIWGLLAFLVVYFNWRFIYKETPTRVEEVEAEVEVEVEVEAEADLDPILPVV